MKRKLAVYANGFNRDPLTQALKGIREYAAKEDFDIFVFMSFASYSEHQSLNQGELNIYELAEMQDFDGAIIFSTHLNNNDKAVELCTRARDLHIPVVSVGMEIEGVSAITVDNNSGMEAMVTHLIEDHQVKRILFMGGTPDHVDSIARLETTRRVMEEHGLTLSSEDIVYGDWGNDGPKAIVERLAASGSPLPDAIVCANDIMALAAASRLLELGYSLPEDVIVTGFDNIAYSRTYYPALTTVDQNYEEIGRRSCEEIFRQIREGGTPEKIVLPSVFMRAESCGCTDQPEFEKRRRKSCQVAYQNHINSSLLEMHERVLRSRISEINDYKDLKNALRHHYLRNHVFEGNDYYVVTYSEYFQDPITSEEELFITGNRNNLEVIAALKDGQVLMCEKTTRSELVPLYQKEEGKQNVYYFCPLHFFQYNYGYIILVNDPPIISLDMLYPYLEKIQQSFKLLRINLRLECLNKDLTRIYNRDPMTGLYNRLAYEEKAMVLFENSIQSKTSMVVMFVDINYMKHINDEFGHLHGDNAIKTVADAIKSILTQTRIAVRFGGDEFLIIAANCGETEAIDMRRSIMTYLDIKNHDGTQPYDISASCGYVITDPASPETLQDYVKEADKLMYKIKQEIHARDAKSAR